MSINLPSGILLDRFCLTAIIIVSGFCELTAQPSETKSPEARYLHQMVFDEGSGQVLVFGGTCGYKMFGDLWAVTGVRWGSRYQ